VWRSERKMDEIENGRRLKRRRSKTTLNCDVIKS
jgi:hypothetical protein